MENPFLVISKKLESLEALILDLKNHTIPELANGENQTKQKIVDLDGLIKARPMIGSKSTIYKKVSAGQIPHSKSGKRLIFDLNVIDQWLLSNQIKTTDEIEAEAFDYMNLPKRKGGRTASKYKKLNS